MSAGLNRDLAKSMIRDLTQEYFENFFRVTGGAKPSGLVSA